MAKAGYDVQAAVELQEKFVALSKGPKQWRPGRLIRQPPALPRARGENRQQLALYPGGLRNKSQFERAMSQVRKDAPPTNLTKRHKKPQRRKIMMRASP